MWETKEYSCCVTDERHSKQTAWVTCLRSQGLWGDLGFSITMLVPHPQVHTPMKRKCRGICYPGIQFPYLNHPFLCYWPSALQASSCKVRELKTGLTSNLPVTIDWGTKHCLHLEQRGGHFPMNSVLCPAPAPVTAVSHPGGTNPAWAAPAPWQALAVFWLGVRTLPPVLGIRSLTFLFLLISIYCI